MTTETEEKEDPFETPVAILIALITVVGAIVAWRASVAADGAGDADNGGLRAMLNVEETRALNGVNAYENYGAFVAYDRYAYMGDLLEADLAVADEADFERLEADRADAQDLAIANQSLFPNKFLNRDGTYDVQRQLGELWADAAREKDLNPEPQFVEADKLRDRTNWFLGDIALLSLGLVFLTLVESVPNQLKYVLTGLGLLTLLVGTGAAFWIEFWM